LKRTREAAHFVTVLACRFPEHMCGLYNDLNNTQHKQMFVAQEDKGHAHKLCVVPFFVERGGERERQADVILVLAYLFARKGERGRFIERGCWYFMSANEAQSHCP
jgi:hypothetical protein